MRNKSHLFRIMTMPLALGIVVCMLATNKTLAEPPDQDQVKQAEATTDTLFQALLAAVLSVTAATTEDNIDANSQAISLLLPKGLGPYRLLDGTGEPINSKNKPKGQFEKDALAEALNNGDSTPVQAVRRNKLLTVVPLALPDPNIYNCALCHSNYNDFEQGAIIGAISLRVPIPE